MKIPTWCKLIIQLVVGYLVIAIVAFGLDKLLLNLTGIVFRDSSIMIGDVLIVDHGIAYKNYWYEDIGYYVVISTFIVTYCILWQDKTSYRSLIDRILTSRKYHVLSFPLLLLSLFGYLFHSKGWNDLLSFILAWINLVIAFLLILRLIWREIYIRHNRHIKTGQALP